MSTGSKYKEIKSLCNNNHLLVYMTSRSNATCNGPNCGKRINNTYTCETCNYDLCESCAENKVIKAFCPKNHVLILSTHNKADCNGEDCNKKGLTLTYTCSACDYDLCPSCAYIKKNINKIANINEKYLVLNKSMKGLIEKSNSFDNDWKRIRNEFNSGYCDMIFNLTSLIESYESSKDKDDKVVEKKLEFK